MAKKAAVAVLLALSVCLAFPQSDKGALIEGAQWAYLIVPPDGWIVDGRTLRTHGIQGLFYKAGTKYSPSKLNMYISPAPKGQNQAASLADFIKEDEAAYMKSNSGTRIRDLAPYSAGMEYSYVLRDFDDDNAKYYQCLGYYEGEKAFFVFVLSCRTSAERERERASFLELLDSFTYIRKE